MEDKYLTKQEHSRLEINQKDQKIHKLEKMLHQKDLLMINMQKEILKLKIELCEFSAYKTGDLIAKKEDNFAKSLETSKKYHEDIEQKHSLKKGWGFDPESLKIIEKEN